MRSTPRPTTSTMRVSFGAITLFLVAGSLLSIAVAETRGDEPRGLGRLFRFGNRGNSSSTAEPGRNRNSGRDAVPPPGDLSSGRRPTSDTRSLDPSESLISEGSPYGAANGNPYGSVGGRAAALPPLAVPPAASDPGLPLPDPGEASAAGPRLIPQPRVSSPLTTATPILTRVQLGRSDDGGTFGMFLQIYADGTVIDTEGVHKVGGDVMRPLIEALRAADVGRIKGHCGGPPVDFVQQVLITVYDLNRGRLQANHFSYSGNPQGCDPAIQRLQQAIDAVQMGLTTGAATGDPRPATARMIAPPSVPPASANDAAPMPPPLGTPRVADSIPLSPLE